MHSGRARLMLWRKGVRECARCGGQLIGPDQATLEHIVPLSVGGRTIRSNLTLSHPACNQQAGRTLWLDQRERRCDPVAQKTNRSACFWYEVLLGAGASSPVAKPHDQGFQIISAIELTVTLAEGAAIRRRAELVKRYGKGSWLKRKGQAVVRMDDGTIRRVELHWYEAHGIGRRELKIKQYLDL